jgi:hypothetical protein
VKDSIPLAEARRIALAAQGFAEPRPAPGARLDRRHLGAVLRRIGLLQIDSVNVLVRSHYLPLFARLGAYPTALLDGAAWNGRRPRDRVLFEYWGHEASLLPVELQPLLRWRMRRAEAGVGTWREVARVGRERRDLVEAVFAEVAARGPIGASELTAAEGRGRSAWWGWSDGKRALEYLFWAGRVTTAGRRQAGFERLYDLPERVLPEAVLAAPTPSEEDAHRALLLVAARALGVATESDLRDYFRLDVADVRARLAELVEAGGVIPIRVDGWGKPAYLDPAARLPRRVEVPGVLLSPFDSLVWERPRTERLFGFRYRLEIYTPAEKRQHGYYVLPFLLGDRLVARVDLKADRAAKALAVHAAHAEPGIDIGAAAEALQRELTTMALWLGLERVVLRAAAGAHGGLAGMLARP